MKHLFSSGIALLVLFTFFSCTNNSKVVNQKSDQKEIQKKPEVEKVFADVNGERQVIKEIHYYPSGQKKSEGGYKNKKRNGLWTYWYENGNKWSEGIYADGLEEGTRSVWYENGKKHHEGNYLHGKEIGIWNFWDENGKLLKQIDYSTKSK